MKTTFTTLLFFAFFFSAAFGQVTKDVRASRCATHDEFMEHVKSDPSALERKELFDRLVENAILQESNGGTARSVV